MAGIFGFGSKIAYKQVPESPSSPKRLEKSSSSDEVAEESTSLARTRSSQVLRHARTPSGCDDVEARKDVHSALINAEPYPQIDVKHLSLPRKARQADEELENLKLILGADSAEDLDALPIHIDAPKSDPETRRELIQIRNNMSVVLDDPRFTFCLNKFDKDLLERLKTYVASGKITKLSPIGPIISGLEAKKANTQHKGFKKLTEEADAFQPNRILAKSMCIQMCHHYGRKTRQRGIDTGVGVAFSVANFVVPGAGELAAKSIEFVASKAAKEAFGRQAKGAYSDRFHRDQGPQEQLMGPNNRIQPDEEYKVVRALMEYLAEPRQGNTNQEDARMALRHSLGALNDGENYTSLIQNPGEHHFFDDPRDMQELITRHGQAVVPTTLPPEKRDFLRSMLLMEYSFNLIGRR